ncbi:ABC transporter ATP-binding protein [Actinomyces bowdenii]|uniref:ABC transporter ATP-binding protein n=1 Tax=Actinomyces bowdenii TaxID=131109 RepID=A0A853EFV8_9ACTO|nr:ABC transporter ATP-binding protein [Actinomyces bowdenii]MBF0695881.1 ABC transporter ATP-binding protein [Actinomyces bowdenii]MDO5092626.1 ABC transporter ATP-binding protein [Propionibacteriaceae bacterium]NYS68054.1 ABC transporter ATP-binding protein [Actinomyces bowdenii]
MKAVIETRGLRKSFGKVHAVRGIDLTVERGSIYGLIGPNGAGKSTTLRMLVDIIRPDDGTVSVLGEAPRSSKPELRRRIGYLPGEIKLTERIPAESVLEHFASISGPVTSGTIQELAERLELDLHRPVRTLSKGNRQKLGLIQAFMHHPELLILDEPTSGLDPLMQREFLSMIREAQENGQTVLLSSHILGEIQHTADAAAVLAHGTIVAEGEIASLRLSGSSRLRSVLEGSDAQRVQAELQEIAHLTDLAVREVGDQLIQVSGLLRGEPDSAVKILARHTIRELTLEEPDLEGSVLELYENAETLS